MRKASGQTRCLRSSGKEGPVWEAGGMPWAPLTGGSNKSGPREGQKPSWQAHYTDISKTI